MNKEDMKVHEEILYAYNSVREANLKSLCTKVHSNYMAFWKKAKVGDGKKISGNQGVGRV
jgi:hypothetical protein